MKDIDFLPQRYRRDRAGRTVLIWRIGGIGVLVGALACAWLYDATRQRQLRRTLAEATRQHEQMMALASQFSALDSQWVAVNARAELWTYLRHPWPKTQIMAALVDRLPDMVWLDEVRIDRQQAAEVSQVGLLRDAVRSGQASDAQAEDTRTPAQRDLARLQGDCDLRPLVVSLRGTTTGIAELHAYLAAIGKANVFLQADLVSLERESSTHQNVYRFVAKVTVRPAYGQPNGPTMSLAVGAAESSTPRQAAHTGANGGNQPR